MKYSSSRIGGMIDSHRQAEEETIPCCEECGEVDELFKTWDDRYFCKKHLLEWLFAEHEEEFEEVTDCE